MSVWEHAKLVVFFHRYFAVANAVGNGSAPATTFTAASTARAADYTVSSTTTIILLLRCYAGCPCSLYLAHSTSLREAFSATHSSHKVFLHRRLYFVMAVLSMLSCVAVW